MAAINKVSYSGYDFETLLDDMRSRIQVQYASIFNDFSLSSLATVLLDSIAFGLDTLTFYLDRRATEVYLSTARTRSAVARLSRQLGYKMGAAVSSSVDLSISLAEVQTLTVVIPEKFKFKGPDSIQFEAAREITIPPGSGPEDIYNVPCYQGRTEAESFTSDGTSNQTFELRRTSVDEFIVNGSLEVLVDGAPFEEKEFLEYGNTDQYEINYGDAPPTLRFGDGIVGSIPTNGAAIDVSYVVSFGKAGQVSKETITDVVSSLVIGTTKIDLVITNLAGATGGDDIESIERVKSLAGKVFKSRDVAITAQDYAALSTAFSDPLFGRVAIAKAINPKTANTDLALQNSLVTLQGYAAEPYETVTTEGAAALEGVSSAYTKQTDIKDYVSDLESEHSTITTTETNNIVVAARTINTSTTEVGSYTATIKSSADTITTGHDLEKLNIETILSGVAVPVPDEASYDLLSTETANAIKAELEKFKEYSSGKVSRIKAEATNVDSAISQHSVKATEIITAVAQNSAIFADTIGNISTSGTLMYDLYNSAVDTETLLGESGSGVTGNVETMVLAVEDHQTDIINITNDIEEHFDKILFADCKANLVVVPILTRDRGGFYAAPSFGLISSLQTFLEARKAVTQVVQVVSGETFLVPAELSITCYIGTKDSISRTKVTVGSILDNLLKDREFGASLYVSDIDHAIRSGLGDVLVVITDILGYTKFGSTLTDLIDSKGNLIIDGGKVITKGSVNISIVVSS